MVVIAVDIGGTKLEVGRVDPDGGILWRRRCATRAHSSAEELWGDLRDLVDAAVALSDEPGADPTADVVGIGVGTGGPMTAGGRTVSPLNIPAWRDFPLRQRLAETYGLPVVIDNDAKAFALAEGWKGAAVGVDNYMAMVVSTGVGGGIVLDGRLLDGADSNAGHIGHVSVVANGRRCACGGRGCLEAEASGTAIAAATGGLPADAAPEVRRRCGELVGRAVGMVANLLGIEMAVVAGSVALGFGETFFAAASDAVRETATLPYARDVRILPAGCGADGPLLGAAALMLTASAQGTNRTPQAI